MLLLGINSDDKGKQLEDITVLLLKTLGYVNITVNLISAGGAEADVTADLSIPRIGGNSTIQLICECKARKTAANMEDWQKFLGKVHLHQMGESSHVQGCFLSLSGYNGNVIGSYRDYRKLNEQIELVTEDAVYSALQKHYSIMPEIELREQLRRRSSRTVKALDLCYHASSLVWLVQFDDDTYTLLGSSSEALSEAIIKRLSPMIEAETTATTFIDLTVDEKAKTQQTLVIKSLLAKVVSSPVSLEPEFLSSRDYTDAERDDALEYLKKQNLIRADGKAIQLTEWPSDLEKFAQVVRYWTHGPLPTRAINEFLCSSFFDKHFTEDLLEFISKIQGDLPLPRERYDEALLLLKMSPSAFAFATTPQGMFLQHRVVNVVEGFDSDRYDQEMLFEALYEGFHRDFLNPVLQGFFYVKHGIREVEVQKKFILKGRSETIQEAQAVDRTIIGVLDETLGGAFMHLRGLHDAPQPWETQEPDNESVAIAFNKIYMPSDDIGPIFYDQEV